MKKLTCKRHATICILIYNVQTQCDHANKKQTCNDNDVNRAKTEATWNALYLAVFDWTNNHLNNFTFETVDRIIYIIVHYGRKFVYKHPYNSSLRIKHKLVVFSVNLFQIPFAFRMNQMYHTNLPHKCFR